MPPWFLELDAVQQALIATLFTWGVTALGAACIFIFKTVNRKLLDAMLGFAAGVMIAASFWSLLAPAIAMAAAGGGGGGRPAAGGGRGGGGLRDRGGKILPPPPRRRSST